jgi:hypothetical protein
MYIPPKIYYCNQSRPVTCQFETKTNDAPTKALGFVWNPWPPPVPRLASRANVDYRDVATVLHP